MSACACACRHTRGDLRVRVGPVSIGSGDCCFSGDVVNDDPRSDLSECATVQENAGRMPSGTRSATWSTGGTDLIRPQAHLELLAVALGFSDLSICQKMHFGCVIADLDLRRLGVGYNHSIRPDLCRRACLREGIKSGARLELCYAVHAEQAAVVNMLWGGLYVPHTPLIAYVAGRFPDGREYESDGFSCTFCVRVLKEAGVDRIVMPNSRTEYGYVIQDIDEAVETSYEVAEGRREAYTVSLHGES